MTSDPDSRGPLAGIRVVDVGTRIGAPFAATVLGEFGADVIKVEDPRGGDFLRHIGPFAGGDGGDGGYSLFWATEGRTKRSVTLDLRVSEGQAVFRRLAAVADVVVENFRPGTMEAWGLGPADLEAVNAGLVYSRVSVYGQDGPYAARPGLDRMGIALGGLLYVTGEPGRPPQRPGVVVGDYLTGVFNAFGIMVALWERQRSGRGQSLDLALYESVLRVLEAIPAAFDVTGEVRERSGNRLAHSAPLDNYVCADGVYVCIVGASDANFARLCAAIGRPDLLDDPRYDSLAERAASGDELNDVVGAWCAQRASREVVDTMVAAGVPVARAASIADVFDDPQVAARSALVEVDDPVVGPLRQQGVTPRLSRTPGAVGRGAPRLGEHNDEVYRGLLGMTREELDRLKDAGVV